MDKQQHRVNKWDLIIAHPPCTYISNAGAARLFPKKGQIDKDRYILGLKGKLFFMAFWYYGIFECGKIAIENPIPSRIYEMPEKTQAVQPYEFGDPYSKKNIFVAVWTSQIEANKYCQPDLFLGKWRVKKT